MEADVGASADEATTSENGLRVINGLATINGLHVSNGLAVINGLSTIDGLSPTTGLITTTDGRATIGYIVRCALPAGTSITKAGYTFNGQLGLAPEWQNGACDTNCQEAVSACLLAHVNTAGIHVPLWLTSQDGLIGWGQDPEFPNMEGAFFGNVFNLGAHGTDPSTLAAFYCTGAKYNINPPQGRIGSAQTSPPYVNPFGSTYASCIGTTPTFRCTTADYPSQNDGFKACGGWNHVVTVWRQNTTTITTSTTGGVGKGYRWK